MPEANARDILEMIPEITEVDRAFPAGPRIEEPYKALDVVAEPMAKAGELDEGMETFSSLFYNGQSKSKAFYKKQYDEVELTEADYSRAFRWVTAAMGSFVVKHEVKERVCGLVWQTFFVYASKDDPPVRKP
jgi:hypothetical protein